MADSPVAYAVDDIINLEVPEDDLLASEFELGSCLPELNSANILGLHAEAATATAAEDLLGVEGSDAEMGDADPVNDVHLDVQEAIKALLHLNSNSPAPALQDHDSKGAATPQVPPAMLKTTTSASCMTSETTPSDDTEMANGIDLTIDDDDCNSNDSGRWSTEVNPPDDAVWCMSNVPDWEAGFSAWCSAHQGQSFHHMLLHCVIQCTTCLATFCLTADKIWCT